MKARTEELSLFESELMDDQDFRSLRDVVQNLPPLEEVEEPAPCPPAVLRRLRTLSCISLRVLATLNVPLDVVRIVEDNVGWPEVIFGNPEAGGQILLNQMNSSRELVTMVQALVQAMRDISRNAWTADILYVMQNLQSYDAQLRSLLEEMELFRRMRAPANPLQLGPGLNDLTRLAQALEALATDLAVNGCLVINIDQDQHIPTLHQLVRFLN